ncbi:MAG: hypothetical protein ACYTXY_50670, partial [Nostoc sp.]
MDTTAHHDYREEVKDCLKGVCSLRVRPFAIDGNRQDCNSLTAAPAVQHEQIFTNTEISNILDAANQGACPSKEAIASRFLVSAYPWKQESRGSRG